MPKPSLAKVTSDIAHSLAGGLTDSATPASRKLLVVGGFLASGLRLAAGTVIGTLGPRPAQRLVLWDFERCPHSRPVREALSTLDLDAEVRPCPKGGTRFRPALEGRGVPRLQDPNTNDDLRGSMNIVRHLYAHYGQGRPPWLLNLTPVRFFTGMAARFLTGQRGALVRPSRAPEKPLELWSFESSPYCRMVRATLCELELPYVLHNVAKGSEQRAAFIARSGQMRVPFLVDPNTGAALFESAAIERYLEATYAA